MKADNERLNQKLEGVHGEGKVVPGVAAVAAR